MKKAVLLETSARHLHVSREDLDVLFGAGYELTHKKDLSQPGQFATAERVTIKGPKGAITASILGPVRPATQVELSFTDARAVGLKVPLRESGDIAGSPGCTLVGPAGEVELPTGVIAAKRHIHASPEEAETYGIADRDVVAVRVSSEGRSLVFEDVVVRVHPNFRLALHLDTDEANAACVTPGLNGELFA